MSTLSKLLAVAIAAGTTLAASAAPINLVNNGGFESGDFSGWTQFGNTAFNGVGCGGGVGGSCAAFFGPIGPTAGGISQVISGLTVGAQYAVSFAFGSTGDVPSSITVALGGTTVLNQTNPPATVPSGAFNVFAYSVTATAASETLSFSFRNDPSFFLLDNVSVSQNVPEPGALALVGIALAGLSLSRRRRATL
jgi:hypothetical protein